MTAITPQNILQHELIGLNVRVVQSTNDSAKGIHGIVIDETRNMLTIMIKGGKVMIPKNTATFRFRLPSGTRVDVSGDRLVAKPENRLKMRLRRW